MPDTVTASPELEQPPLAPELVAPLAADEPLIEDELLVEDVSIDGMCGVY